MLIFKIIVVSLLAVFLLSKLFKVLWGLAWYIAHHIINVILALIFCVGVTYWVLSQQTFTAAVNDELTYVATHKHQLGHCTGFLILTDKSVLYYSARHFLGTNLRGIQFEGDAIQDRSG